LGVDDDNDGGVQEYNGMRGHIQQQKKCVALKNLIFTHSSQTKKERERWIESGEKRENDEAMKIYYHPYLIVLFAPYTVSLTQRKKTAMKMQ
jgi:hypothetical protein